MRTTAYLLVALMASASSAQHGPTTGYAPVNGLRMYYEVHGSGAPVVLLHGGFMSIDTSWAGWIDELARTRKVIAVEMQGHGRTADIPREPTSDHLADDVAALLEHLGIARADVIGYSMGGGVALRVAVRHPERVRKAVILSSAFRRDGMGQEGLDALKGITAEVFEGSPIESEYLRLSPTPDQFPRFVERTIAVFNSETDLTADQIRSTSAPMFFIHGDADGIRLDHIAEMYRLKGGELHGDLRPHSASRLAILPNATHVTLMDRTSILVPMVIDFLDAEP